VVRTTRRAFLIGGAALLATPAIAQTKPRIVILGGGFGGAACARALHRADPGFEITLVEPNPTFTACPFSNAVIAGLRDIAAQRFGYDAIRAPGITVAQDQATAVDPQARRVTLRDGSTLDYDRLVLTPGIAIRWDALPGYDAARRQ
jgi:sulfide dehydrogenase [flavocytochrome c] flavoprotein subunit